MLIRIQVRVWCPYCFSAHIHRSRRKLWERIFSLVALPCRCGDCDERFFRWRWQVAAMEAAGK
ncbi:MAG TPA: hypothetical protein VMB03_14745 [Bryobacteraceae bacterium]|nr:hypothetical protein [Bryobacteraceae bacterium]